jgi:hypothetical protein
MAALTSAAVRVAGTFYTDVSPLSIGGKAAITVALLVVTLLSNVCGVKVWNLYVSNSSGNLLTFKIFLILFLFIFMIAVNLGRKFNTSTLHWALESFLMLAPVGGPRTGPRTGSMLFWISTKKLGLPLSDYTIDSLPDSFRPGGFNTTGGFSGEASGESVLEIPGGAGKFLAIW